MRFGFIGPQSPVAPAWGNSAMPCMSAARKSADLPHKRQGSERRRIWSRRLAYAQPRMWTYPISLPTPGVGHFVVDARHASWFARRPKSRTKSKRTRHRVEEARERRAMNAQQLLPRKISDYCRQSGLAEIDLRPARGQRRQACGGGCATAAASPRRRARPHPRWSMGGTPRPGAADHHRARSRAARGCGPGARVRRDEHGGKAGRSAA